MFDKGRNTSMMTIKVQSKDLALAFDADDETDITSQFKIARATDEFFQVCLPRCKIAMRGGELKAIFDWQGIKRIKLEAEVQAAKRAALKQRLEEERAERELLRVQRQLDAKLKLEQDEQHKREEALEAERKAKEDARLAAERAEREKWEKMESLGVKFTQALLNGGPGARKRSEKQVEIGFDVYKGCFYFVDLDSNTVTWRDPRIASPWEKTWVEQDMQFHFTHVETGEVLFEEPYASQYEKIWVEESHSFYYVDKVTGDATTEEPYY